MRRWRNEAGTAVIETPLAIVLLLVPIALLVITLPTWPERQTVARAAASQAARSAVLADSWDDAVAAGQAVVERTAANYGLAAGDFVLDWSGALTRGSAVTARVTVRMPALAIPGLGSVGAWTWTASHTENVDRYRSLP
ncbi:MAG TPA: hypothetical protein VHL53_20705 [Acidimicrobiia bacterium]|nr:hypothetical protein [Acidimicrobiia bacterium]